MTAVGSDRGEIDEMTRGILIRPLKLVFFSALVLIMTMWYRSEMNNEVSARLTPLTMIILWKKPRFCLSVLPII